jgi:hypothetical protein
MNEFSKKRFICATFHRLLGAESAVYNRSIDMKNVLFVPLCIACIYSCTVFYIMAISLKESKVDAYI